MTTILKTYPYEVLLRFSSGEAHQEQKLGEFEAAHFIERTRFVDDQTGEIVGTPKGEEQDRAIVLPREKIIEYLGENFVAFEAQQRALQGELADARKVNGEITAVLAERDATIQSLTAQLEATTAAHDAVAARNAAAAAALAS